MSPRRSGPRTIGAEDRLRTAVRQWLDDNERSIPWLARQITEAGCPIAATSLWKALNAGRAIYVDEAVALTTVTGIPIDRP